MDFFWNDVVKGVGLPTALLVLILKYVVVPITEKYIEFVDKAIVHMGQISVTQSKIVETVALISERLDKIDANIGKEKK